MKSESKIVDYSVREINVLNDERKEHEQLRTLIGVVILTSIPLLVFSIYISLKSNSLSVIAVILDSGINLLLNLVSFFVLRIAARSNVFQFPYGTGKLENFTSFLHGCGIVVVGITILYNGLMRLTVPPVTVSLGFAQLALIAGLARLFFIVFWLSRMVRQYPQRSPLLNAYYINFTAAIRYISALILAMMTGWLLTSYWGSGVSLVVDLLIAVFFSGYLVLNGIKIIHTNFRSLLDLPLSEQDQLIIIRSLIRHYDAYTHLGNIFTRTSGGSRRIEIQFFFSPDTTGYQIESLYGKIYKELKQHFGKIEFHLIARFQEQ